MEKKRLLVIGSGSENYRRYILETAVQMGLEIILVSNRSATWEIGLCKKIIFSNIDNAAAMYERLSKSIDINSINGIFTYVEEAVYPTAQLAQILGLPFISVQTAQAARNKYVMRKRFEESGLKTPNYVKIRSIEDLQYAQDSLKLPVVIKPIDGWGSIGVIKVEKWEELKGIFEKISKNKFTETEPTFILEEYLIGNEVSVESVIFNKKIHHYGIVQKYICNEPYFEEVGHSFPAELPDDLIENTLNVTAKGIEALGINSGVTHTELRLTPSGPVIVEIGARLGGDKIPYLIQLATGINLARNAIKVALGQNPDFEYKFIKGSAIKFFVPPSSCEILEYPDFVDVIKLSNVHELRFKPPFGLLKVPPEGFFTRMGYVVTCDITGEKAYKTACTAEDLIKIKYVEAEEVNPS
ncbi:ATP-grasp domain-containing protein [Geosporobacter ferrireducens]|uniref:ATP-grasp domain-containing protein n=1 Tax=Geosporobacter ferrireducens TaxID=1424294 RepID=A0A1D8GI45_9FIRM|nr:ATP-grasp domain-containing protein [Geosporobacter ferrireducens]AOT70569.1 hypothetical protein Gferi_13900 [Geosporobacter ferrireducens]